MNVADAAGMILHLAACTRDSVAKRPAEPPTASGAAEQDREAPAAAGIAFPGARSMPTELKERLWQAYEAQGPDYEPRSEHLAPDGWHVNAHRPLQDFLLPTRLAVADEGAADFELGDVEYPQPETVTLGFQDEPLAVYQGRVPIVSKLAANGGPSPAIAPLNLTIQACDDRKRLPPEDLFLEVSSLPE